MAGGDIRRAAGQPPPEHPYAALALTLALAGSPTWTTTAARTDDSGDDGDGDDATSSAAANAGGGAGAIRRGGSAKEEHEDEELAGFGGDSSRLWSTDSEPDEEYDGSEGRDGEEGAEAEKGGRGPAEAPLPPLPEDADGRDTQEEWLRAFESDGERSPRTDGERKDQHPNIFI